MDTDSHRWVGRGGFNRSPDIGCRGEHRLRAGVKWTQMGMTGDLTVGGPKRRVWGSNHHSNAMKLKLESCTGAAIEWAGGVLLVDKITMCGPPL